MKDTSNLIKINIHHRRTNLFCFVYTFYVKAFVVFFRNDFLRKEALLTHENWADAKISCKKSARHCFRNLSFQGARGGGKPR
jgi:hypothetical protein